MRAVQPCGTEAALKRHARAGQKACEACLKAGARAQMDRKRKRVEQAKQAAQHTPQVDWDAAITRFKADMAERYADEENAA